MHDLKLILEQMVADLIVASVVTLCSIATRWLVAGAASEAPVQLSRPSARGCVLVSDNAPSRSPEPRAVATEWKSRLGDFRARPFALPYLPFFPLFGACVRAEAATDFAAALDFGLASIFDALEATLLDVVSPFLDIYTSPRLALNRCDGESI